ncbi:MAG: hypothetical protein IJV69_01085 [Kiritimatiellae bacterium]|nr:hypothetical protein [Kiritimatiellia bacterium]
MNVKMLGWLMVALCLPFAALAQQKTLYVARVTASDSLKAELARDSRAMQLGRITEAIDDHLITEITKSRKFRMVERSDALEELIKEQDLYASGLVSDRGAEVNGMTGAELALFVTVDSFQQVTDTGVFSGVHRLKTKYQLSAQMRVVDTTTAEILEASNVQLEKMDVADVTSGMTRPEARFDILLPQMTREMAAKSVKQLISATFPPKVIDVDEDVVTINAGSDVFKVGDKCKIYGKTRTVTDPDTGVTRKIKGRLSGEVRIIDVESDYAQAELIGNARAVVGAMVKPITKE